MLASVTYKDNSQGKIPVRNPVSLAHVSSEHLSITPVMLAHASLLAYLRNVDYK